MSATCPQNLPRFQAQDCRCRNGGMESRLTSNAPACFSGRQPVHTARPLAFCSPRHARLERKLRCSAQEGSLIHSRFPGFSEEDAEPLQDLVQQKSLITPESASWGLSVAQMRAMGITSESERHSNIDPVSPHCDRTRVRFLETILPWSCLQGLGKVSAQNPLFTYISANSNSILQDSIRAVNYYGGDRLEPTMAGYRQPTVMAAGTGAAPGQVPPDLPSLLLDARICYIGMPVSHVLAYTLGHLSFLQDACGNTAIHQSCSTCSLQCILIQPRY